jgi:hypothetical protein
MPNPSELQRLEEEEIIEQQIQNALDILRDLVHIGSKWVKERYLADLRRIESELGIESIPYNSENFYERSKNALLHLRRGTN